MGAPTASCPGCRRDLAAGDRFCDSCGSPVAPMAANPTPVPPAAQVAAPPAPLAPAWEDAPPPFAGLPSPETTPPAWRDRTSAFAAGPSQADGPAAWDDDQPQRDRTRRLLGLLVTLAVAAAVIVTAVVWQPWRDDPATEAASAPTAPSPGSPAAPSASPDDAMTGSLVGLARATAPSTSPEGVDGAGNPTSYEAAQMLDEDPATTWRMDGDGTGVTVTLVLDRPRPVNRLGLINGYAKVDPFTGQDRYVQGRRISGATWTLGGNSYSTSLIDGFRGMQVLEVPTTTTDTVELTITGVTPPGDRQFDRTAISDVLIANELAGHGE